MKKRRRLRQTKSLQVRLSDEAERLGKKAARMPPGPERMALLAKARQMKEAAEMTDFLAASASGGAGQEFSGGHSGQVSPIDSSTSVMAASAAAREMPAPKS